VRKVSSAREDDGYWSIISANRASASGRLQPVVDTLILSFERPLRGEAATGWVIGSALLFGAETVAENRNFVYTFVHPTTAD
jgi:hypothetical protein